MTTSADEHDQARLMAAIALSAQRREPVTEAPDPQEWRAFVAGRLDLERSEKWLEYIDANPDAYQAWLAEAGTTKPPGVKPLGSRAMDVLRSVWLAPALAVAAVAAVALLLTVQTVDPLDDAYRTVAELARGADRPLSGGGDALADGGDSVAFGFSGGGKAPSHVQAFVDGIGAGRRQLEEQLGAPPAEAATSAAASKAWYRLGRWYYLNWFVSRTGLSPDAEFWQRQGRTLGELRQALAGETDAGAAAVDASLDRLDAELAKLGGAPDNRRYRHQLERSLRELWALMQVAGNGA